jgi:hypothetical protein
MHIQLATRGDIESALYWVNEYFDQNIEFSKFVEASPGYFMVRFRVIDVNKIGHVITRYKPIVRLPTACSHVHRAFFLELPDESEIFDGQHWWKRSEGYFPVIEKYPCECEEQVKVAYTPRRVRRNIDENLRFR